MYTEILHKEMIGRLFIKNNSNDRKLSSYTLCKSSEHNIKILVSLNINDTALINGNIITRVQ